MDDLENINIIVKTKRGYENVTASLIEEILPGSKVYPKPLNYAGLVLVRTDEKDAEKTIEEEIPEAEKVLSVKVCTRADIESIIKGVGGILNNIDGSFAVRTTRRGKHNFSSIDVNIKVGEIIKNKTKQDVNLDFPDKIVLVEIIDKYAYICIADGKKFPKKKSREKVGLRDFFRKVCIIQMPYLGKHPAPLEMGTRIGRESQTFEVGELIIAPLGASRAEELEEFLRGVLQGINSRYQIQKRVYPHNPRRVNVYVQNLYEVVRERRDENMVVFEPEGRPVSKVLGDLANMIIKGKRTNFLIGSREGIPTGIYRFADLIIDLCPGVTIATDSAISSALIALSFSLQEKLDGLTEIP